MPDYYTGCTETVSHLNAIFVPISFAAFYLLGQFIDLLISNGDQSDPSSPSNANNNQSELSHVKNGYVQPKIRTRTNVPSNPRFRWRFRNICISFLHSLIISTWAIVNVTSNPQMIDDPIDVCTKSFYLFVTVIIGYFYYDTFDLLLNEGGKETAEMLPHHLVLIFLYSVGLYMRTYLGYAVISMLAEVNSVFLHARHLLKMKGVDRSNLLYRALIVANLGSFLVFRFGVFLWMGHWQLNNYHRVPLFLNAIGAIGLVAMMVINGILFYRLIKTDVLQSRTKKD